MTTRRFFTKALALTTMLTALTAGLPAAFAQDLQTVRMGVDPYTTGTQIWVARDKGFFADHGIEADITVYATGIEALDSALVGRSDIGVGLDFPTALRMQSHQLTLLAAVFASSPGWHKLVVSEAIADDTDLAGKRFGIATGTAQHLVTEKYLEMKGVAHGEAELIPFTSLVEIVASLRSGRLDGAFVWADGIAMSTQSDKFRILTDDSEAKLNQSAYISANTAFAKDNREAVVNILKALAEANEFIAANPEETAQILSKNTKAPLESALALIKLNDFGLTLTDAQRDSFAAIAAFASDVIKSPVTFDTAVDPSYLEEAVPGAVTLSN